MIQTPLKSIIFIFQGKNMLGYHHCIWFAGAILWLRRQRLRLKTLNYKNSWNKVWVYLCFSIINRSENLILLLGDFVLILNICKQFKNHLYNLTKYYIEVHLNDKTFIITINLNFNWRQSPINFTILKWGIKTINKKKLSEKFCEYAQ